MDIVLCRPEIIFNFQIFSEETNSVEAVEHCEEVAVSQLFILLWIVHRDIEIDVVILGFSCKLVLFFCY